MSKKKLCEITSSFLEKLPEGGRLYSDPFSSDDEETGCRITAIFCCGKKFLLRKNRWKGTKTVYRKFRKRRGKSQPEPEPLRLERTNSWPIWEPPSLDFSVRSLGCRNLAEAPGVPGEYVPLQPRAAPSLDMPLSPIVLEGSARLKCREQQQRVERAKRNKIGRRKRVLRPELEEIINLVLRKRPEVHNTNAKPRDCPNCIRKMAAGVLQDDDKKCKKAKTRTQKSADRIKALFKRKANNYPTYENPGDLLFKIKFFSTETFLDRCEKWIRESDFEYGKANERNDQQEQCFNQRQATDEMVQCDLIGRTKPHSLRNRDLPKSSETESMAKRGRYDQMRMEPWGNKERNEKVTFMDSERQLPSEPANQRDRDHRPSATIRRTAWERQRDCKGRRAAVVPPTSTNAHETNTPHSEIGLELFQATDTRYNQLDADMVNSVNKRKSLASKKLPKFGQESSEGRKVFGTSECEKNWQHDDSAISPEMACEMEKLHQLKDSLEEQMDMIRRRSNLSRAIREKEVQPQEGMYLMSCFDTLLHENRQHRRYIQHKAKHQKSMIKFQNASVMKLSGKQYNLDACTNATADAVSGRQVPNLRKMRCNVVENDMRIEDIEEELYPEISVPIIPECQPLSLHSKARRARRSAAQQVSGVTRQRHVQ